MPSPIQSLKLGILVPSSNTALEPLTTAIISSLSPAVSVHFSRFTVTQISLSPEGLSQFDFGKIVVAAQLLGDARVDVIGWSGTSGGWLGFDVDEELCRKITEATGGIPATTSTLALNKALKTFGIRDVGFVTPYLDNVVERIVETYETAGFRVVSESHLRQSKNNTFAEVDEEVLDRQVKEVMETGKGGVKAITTFCTNLRAAQRVEYWETEYEVPVFDTVATVVWDMFKMVGRNTGEIKGWGKMFAA